MLEDGLNSPEAPTGKDGGLLGLRACQRRINGGIRDHGGRPVAGIAGDYAHQGD
jgi:hypothetical protein